MWFFINPPPPPPPASVFVPFLSSLQRYEPPPFGPGTSLNRPSYGVVEAKPFFIQQLSRRPQGMLIAGSIATFMALAYIPISKLRCIYCVKLREISYQSHCMRGGGGRAHTCYSFGSSLSEMARQLSSLYILTILIPLPHIFCARFTSDP